MKLEDIVLKLHARVIQLEIAMEAMKPSNPALDKALEKIDAINDGATYVADFHTIMGDYIEPDSNTIGGETDCASVKGLDPVANRSNDVAHMLAVSQQRPTNTRGDFDAVLPTPEE